MNHWIWDDKSPIIPLRDIRPMCDGRPPEPKGDHSLVSQKGSNYFLRIAPNTNTIFKVIGMTQTGIEPRSHGLLVNSLPLGPMSQLFTM